MKDNALRRLFAMIIALAMLTTPIMAVAEEAAEASEPVIEAEGLEPMVEETEAVVLGGEEEVAVEAEAENIAEEVAAPVEAEKTYADEDYPSEDRELVVTKNSVKTSMNVGDTLNVSLDIAGVYASGTWKSSKTKVAVVEEAENEDGNTITALSPGTAKITVKLSNRKTLTITVTVADPYIATDVDFDESAGSAQMRVGDELDLADFIIMEPEWADPSTLTWKSSKSSVAKVDKYGHVTAKKAGKAKITVTTKKTKKKDTIEIQVVANKLTNMFPKPTKAVVSAMAEGGWTFVPASMEMKSNGNLDCQFYLLNGTSLKTKELHNLNIYLAGEDGEPFAYNNFGTVKAAASKNGYKAFKLSFPSAKVDHEVFLPELGDIFIGFEDVDTVYAIANDKYKSELDFIPQDDWHITDSYVPEPQPQNVKVTSITLAPASASLEVAGTTTLTATVLPTNATNKNVSWKSSNVSVATVSNGVVKGLTAGTATITATAADGSGVQGVCTVTVKAAGPAGVKVTKITLDKTTASLEEGKTEKLTATVEPSNATDSKVTWTTSNSSVATVSDGTITAVKAGTATITATAADGSGIKAECAVTVTAPVVKNINLNKESIELVFDDTVQLEVLEGKSATWTTTDSDIATVDKNGFVTAKSKAGTATIIATVGSDSAQCVVTVVGHDATDFEIDVTTAQTIEEGKELEVKITDIKPNNANYKSITWTSSKEDVASITINEKGDAAKIKALAPGKTTIKAVTKLEKGKDKPVEKAFELTVTAAPVIAKTIELSATKLTVEKDKTEVLAVKNILAEDTTKTVTNKAVKYTSTNESVAKVDKENGTVTGIGTGTATIYVNSEDGGAMATCEVTVVAAAAEYVPVKSISFKDSEYKTSINAKEPLKLADEITFTTADADKEASNKGIIWTSSNETIATVDADGVVTGLTAGKSVIITAKSKDNNSATDTCSVKVEAEKIVIPVTGISIEKNKATDPDYIDIGPGSKTTNTMQLKAVIEPSNATTKDVKWADDGKDIVTVNETTGLVTAKKAGTATITAYAKDGKTDEKEMKKSTFTVVVKNIVHVEDVSFDEDKLPKDNKLKTGEQHIMVVKVKSYDSTQEPDDAGVTWGSTVSTVATVSNGLVKAIGPGQTTITATSKDDTSKVAKYVLTVEQPVTGVELDKTGTVEMDAGSTLTLKATVKPDNASNKKVTWKSEGIDGKDAAATVEDGKVTAGKIAGTAKITVTTEDGSKTASVTIKVNRIPLKAVTGVKGEIVFDAQNNRDLKVTWNEEDTGYATHYRVICKQGGKEVFNQQYSVKDDLTASGDKVKTYSITIDHSKLTNGQNCEITVEPTVGQDKDHPSEDPYNAGVKLPYEECKVTPTVTTIEYNF